MPNTISPNMGLIVPTVGQEPGPTWATDLNADLGILDQHDHSSGSGVPVNTNGININADLPMHNNNLTQVNTVNFQAHLASLPGLFPNLGAIYVAGHELYYNDEVGNVVQITNSGSVNAGAGSITGLPSGTASVSYNSGSQTYVFQSATSTPANIDGGSFIFRDIVANSKGVTVSAPPALAADYQMFWPSALPGANSFLTLDNAGGIAAGPAVTGGLTDTNISSKSLTNASIANGTITQVLLAPRSTGSTVAAGGVAISSSCGNFTTGSTSPAGVTGLSVTITTTGRPVFVGLVSDGSGNNAALFATSSNGGGAGSYNLNAIVNLYNGLTSIYTASVALQSFQQAATAEFSQVPSTSVYTIDLSVNGVPGTYTYTVGLNRQTGDNTNLAGLAFSKIIAYEI